MKPGGFFALLVRQLRTDIAGAPQLARRWLSHEGRVARCGNIADLRVLARRSIPTPVFDYVDGAAGDELTADRNERDLRRLTVLPRVLRGAKDVDLATTVLGQPVSVPLMGAPTGLTGLVHHRAEAAIARAVNGAGGIYVLSAVASCGIEEVAWECSGPKWFQLYVWRDRGLVRSMLERARAAGYLALVIAVDVPRAGARERDRRNRFMIPPRITARSLGQGVLRPRWAANFIRRPRIMPESALRSGVSRVDPSSLADLINAQFDPSLGWGDITWLQQEWQGPIVVKGVLRPEDARQAARLDVAGVVVSNHGGRQLDQAPSAISALPAIVDAVGAPTPRFTWTGAFAAVSTS